jgi:hypothetical protein
LKQEGHEVRRTLWGNFETMGEHENYGWLSFVHWWKDKVKWKIGSSSQFRVKDQFSTHKIYGKVKFVWK